MNPVPMKPNLPEATTALGTVVKPKQWGICPHCENLSPMHEREWVGLTDDEIAEAGKLFLEGNRMLPFSLARAIEAKLKEKNGG